MGRHLGVLVAVHPTSGGSPLPALDHGVVVVIVEELLGAAAAAYCYRRFGLARASRRALFLCSGRLDRSVV